MILANIFLGVLVWF